MAPFSGAFWVLYFTVQMLAVVYTHNPPILRTSGLEMGINCK